MSSNIPPGKPKSAKVPAQPEQASSSEPKGAGSKSAKELKAKKKQLLSTKDEIEKSISGRKDELKALTSRKSALDSAPAKILEDQATADAAVRSATRQRTTAQEEQVNTLALRNARFNELDNPVPSVTMSDAASIRTAFKKRAQLEADFARRHDAPHTLKRFFGPLIGAAGAAFEGAGTSMVAYGVARASTQPVATTLGVSLGGVAVMSVPSIREASDFLNQPFEAWEELVRFATGAPSSLEGDEISRALAIEAKGMQAAFSALVNLGIANGLTANAIVGAISLGCAGGSFAASKVFSNWASERVGAAQIEQQPEEGTAGPAALRRALVAIAADDADEALVESGKKKILQTAKEHRARDAMVPVLLAVGAGLGGLLGAMFLFNVSKKAGAYSEDNKTDYWAVHAFAAAANFALMTKNLIAYAQHRFDLPAARGFADAKTIKRDRPERERRLQDTEDQLTAANQALQTAIDHVAEAEQLVRGADDQLKQVVAETVEVGDAIQNRESTLKNAEQQKQEIVTELTGVTNDLNKLLKMQQKAQMNLLLDKPLDDNDDESGPMGV